MTDVANEPILEEAKVGPKEGAEVERGMGGVTKRQKNICGL
jgi:hypothetical protein